MARLRDQGLAHNVADGLAVRRAPDLQAARLGRLGRVDEPAAGVVQAVLVNAGVEFGRQVGATQHQHQHQHQRQHQRVGDCASASHRARPTKRRGAQSRRSCKRPGSLSGFGSGLRRGEFRCQARRLSGLGNVGCETASAVHFLPAFCPIVELWACKSGKNCPRWGRFSLSTPQVRQAPSLTVLVTLFFSNP